MVSLCVGELYLATFLAVFTAVQGKGEWAVLCFRVLIGFQCEGCGIGNSPMQASTTVAS